MAIRNSKITILRADSVVTEIALNPSTGLPASSVNAGPTVAFNLTTALNLSRPLHEATNGPITVDVARTTCVCVCLCVVDGRGRGSKGSWWTWVGGGGGGGGGGGARAQVTHTHTHTHTNTHTHTHTHTTIVTTTATTTIATHRYVFIEELNRVVAIDSSGSHVKGDMQVANADAGGEVRDEPYGVAAMATYVAPATGKSKLVILEKGGPGRYVCVHSVLDL
jgi:hypothetical protein